MTPERKVKNKVAALLKAEGVYFFYPTTHGYGRSGVPDIICCVNGRFLAIECKAGGNQITALQDKEIKAIQKAGGVAMVVNETSLDGINETVQLLRGLR